MSFNLLILRPFAGSDLLRQNRETAQAISEIETTCASDLGRSNLPQGQRKLQLSLRHVLSPQKSLGRETSFHSRGIFRPLNHRDPQRRITPWDVES
jgi:hypothetical protein